MSTEIQSTVKALDPSQEAARHRFIGTCTRLAAKAEGADAERLRLMADRQKRTRENGLVLISPLVLTDARGKKVAPGWHNDF